MRKTPAENMRALYQRKKEQGLTRVAVWAKPTDHARIKAYAAKLAKKPA